MGPPISSDQALRRPRRSISPKMSSVATKAAPADAKASELSARKVHSVKRMPRTVGRQLWKTIAPVMLPIASVSLPPRTQITLLNFSGSSVAIGAMTSARIRGSSPMACDRSSTAPTKTCAPMMISARAPTTCVTMMRSAGGSVPPWSCGSPGRTSMSSGVAAAGVAAGA